MSTTRGTVVLRDLLGYQSGNGRYELRRTTFCSASPR